MKKILLICISIALVFNLSGQTIEEIKNSGNYLYGVGEGKSFREADKSALDVLISQISVRVESNFKSIVSQEDGNVTEKTKIIVKTYSNTTLQQAKSKVLIDEPGHAKVLRYISTDNMKEIFSNRKQKILDYVNSALVAEKDIRIADALKYYYWAFVLLRSHPDYNQISYKFPEEGEKSLVTAIPDRINRLFANLSVNIQNIKHKKEESYKQVILDITYKNKPVRNFDYYYWTGNTWSNLISARNGLGLIELYGSASESLDYVRIKTEYIFENKSKIDFELNEVLAKTDLPYFAKARFRIPMVVRQQQSSHQQLAQQEKQEEEKEPEKTAETPGLE